MDTEQLNTFLTLAETKSFSRTAKQLIVAQSTVSKRIHELERELGEPLFLRERSGAVLTAAGRTLYEYAEQMVNLEKKARKQLRQKEQFSGYLVVGAVYAYFDTALAELLPAFLEAHPDISVEIKLGHTAKMLADLSQALVDVAFTHHPFRHPEYECRLVAQDDLVLVTDAKNTAFRAGIPPEKIRDLPLISSNFLYDTTQSWLFPGGHRFQLELDIARDTLPFLADSKWYALLPRRLVEAALQAGALAEIPILGSPLPPVLYYMSHRRDGLCQDSLRAWLRHLKPKP